MRPSVRFSLAIGVVSLGAAAALMAATENYLAKYGQGGNLVDSEVYESAGNVGIGTATPEARLQVNGEMRAGGTNPLIRAFSSGLGAGQLFLQVVDDSTPRGYVGTNVSSMPLVLASGANVEAVRITADGSVGIATSTPTAKLHVVGNIRVDGNIAAKYQDLAEWVPSRDAIPSGAVVSLSRTHETVHRSSIAYDHAVAGVVSPQPGIVLGEGGPGKVLIAHSGRVRVKVDAGHGAIRRGDLLVTSPTAGHAMKSQPLHIGGEPIHRPGTVLGKAIEPLADGKGEILVLLTLQ